LRILVFTLAIVFIGGLGLLTALDFENNGVTLVGVVGVVVLVVVGVGIIGALIHPPRK
jgi:hypothetical protein